MCQGFGFEKHYEIFEIDRNRPYATPLPDDSVHPGWPGRPRPPGVPGSRRAGQAAGASETNPSGEGWCGQATPLLNDRMHPGWQGWPRPPGVPGSHRAAWASGASATRPGDVFRRGHDGQAVAKTSCWYGRRWPRDGERRGQILEKADGRIYVRTQRYLQSPEASPLVFPGNLGTFGTRASVSGRISGCVYSCRGSRAGHFADGRFCPERHWALALYPSQIATCPVEPLGGPQEDRLLRLDGVGTMSSWMLPGQPFPLRSAALPPIRFLSGASPGSQCLHFPTPWLPEQESVPWGTPRRAPVASLTLQQDRARDLTRVGTPSSGGEAEATS